MSSSFTRPLKYRKLKKGWFHKQKYQILEPFIYHVGSIDSELVIAVPAGFITDFASTPWWMHWKYPPMGWYAKAVLIHDWGYHVNRYTKEWWDNVMKEGMEILARDLTGDVIPKEMQLTIDRFYWAVTKFGLKSWNKK